MEKIRLFLLVLMLMFGISAKSFSSSPNFVFVNLNLAFTPLHWEDLHEDDLNRNGASPYFAVRRYATFLEVENYSSTPYELYILNSQNQTVFYKACPNVVNCAQVSLEGFQSGLYSLYIFTDWGYWFTTFEV